MIPTAPGLQPLLPLDHPGPRPRAALDAGPPRRADRSARHRVSINAASTRDARPARAVVERDDQADARPPTGPGRHVCVPFAVRADGTPEGVCNTPVIREERPLDTRPLHSARPGFPGTPQPFGPRPRRARAFHHPDFSRPESPR